MTDNPRADQASILSWFHSLAPMHPSELIGLWQGEGMASGHPLDGVLENLGWFGKRFHPDLRADALLFQLGPQRLVALEPAYFPIRTAVRLAPFGRTSVARNWFSYLYKILRAKGTTAALETHEDEAGPTAAMAYDRQPIVDHFRRIDETTVAGMMVVSGEQLRYFFRLRMVSP